MQEQSNTKKSNKKIVDLHNHTSLCNHATGTQEEYIKTAIERGVDIFGFSCHNPMNFDSDFRMKFSQIEAYRAEVARLAEKYKGEIEIKYAMEIDFLPQFLDERVLGENFDYRIGAVHFLGSWGFDNPRFMREYEKRDINETWIEYFKAQIELAKSAQFDILAHMDLMKVFKHRPTRDLRAEIESLLREVKKANMAIEINASGLRKDAAEQYPSKEILELAYELEVPITFGSDAHALSHIQSGGEEVRELARQIGYTKCATYTKREREFVEF